MACALRRRDGRAGPSSDDDSSSPAAAAPDAVAPVDAPAGVAKALVAAVPPTRRFFVMGREVEGAVVSRSSMPAP